MIKKQVITCSHVATVQQLRSSRRSLHVEMMGLIGRGGNNPMVGATVACAVAVAEAL